jgi:hypothetical protein
MPLHERGEQEVIAMTAAKALLGSVLLLACSSVSTARNPYAVHYLADPNTSEDVKAAIREGVVVLGMCPSQALAAAGEPGPYQVERDPTRWSDHSDPVQIAEAQCVRPDRSVIELTFSNTSQFGSSEPVVFRVRFENGKADLIDVEGFDVD